MRQHDELHCMLHRITLAIRELATEHEKKLQRRPQSKQAVGDFIDGVAAILQAEVNKLMTTEKGA